MSFYGLNLEKVKNQKEKTNKEFNLQTIVQNYGVIMNSEFSSEDDEWKG